MAECIVSRKALVHAEIFMNWGRQKTRSLLAAGNGGTMAEPVAAAAASDAATFPRVASRQQTVEAGTFN